MMARGGMMSSQGFSILFRGESRCGQCLFLVCYEDNRQVNCTLLGTVSWCVLSLSTSEWLCSLSFLLANGDVGLPSLFLLLGLIDMDDYLESLLFRLIFLLPLRLVVGLNPVSIYMGYPISKLGSIYETGILSFTLPLIRYLLDS